jgi:hypothetical protein
VVKVAKRSGGRLGSREERGDVQDCRRDQPHTTELNARNATSIDLAALDQGRLQISVNEKGWSNPGSPKMTRAAVRRARATLPANAFLWATPRSLVSIL